MKEAFVWMEPARAFAHYSGWMAIRYSALGEIVGRNLDSHLVAGGDPDEVFPHLAGNMRQHLVAVLEADIVHRCRQYFYHRAHNLN